jgi:hypothetical protein
VTIAAITGTRMTITTNTRSGYPSPMNTTTIKIAVSATEIASVQSRFLTISLFTNSLPDSSSTFLTSSSRRGAGLIGPAESCNGATVASMNYEVHLPGGYFWANFLERRHSQVLGNFLENSITW